MHQGHCRWTSECHSNWTFQLDGPSKFLSFSTACAPIKIYLTKQSLEHRANEADGVRLTVHFTAHVFNSDEYCDLFYRSMAAKSKAWERHTNWINIIPLSAKACWRWEIFERRWATIAIKSRCAFNFISHEHKTKANNKQKPKKK